MKPIKYLLLFGLLIKALVASAQVNDDKLGAWYMYFWNFSKSESSLGLQGDVQYRNWNLIGDLEQLLLRGGITWQPENYQVKLTLGYASIITGAYGDSNSTFSESRIYQEALIPHKPGERLYLTHRFRYEQRFVENQDLRTRYRYNLSVNITFNKSSLEQGAIYLAVYNELFINGQRNIGNGNRVQFFDRNRFYGAAGYSLRNNLRIQLGLMQQTTNTWRKTQMQLSLHHSF